MRPLADAGMRGAAFWLLTLANTMLSIAGTASAPLLTRVVIEDLGGDTSLGGFLVSLAWFTSMIGTPLAGMLADRWGARTVILVSGVLGVAGMVLPVLLVGVPSLGTSRLLFGIGASGMSTAFMVWLAADLPAGERSRGLSIYGISVWVGMALGPVLGQWAYHVVGHRLAWLVILVLMAAALACAAKLPVPAAMTHHREESDEPAPSIESVFRSVWLPSLVCVVAWGAEAFIVSFLILHLLRRGVEDEGLLSAPNVFVVFAAAVVASRLLLGSLPDRLGPIVTSIGSLAALGSGVVLMGVADTFWVASLGAVLVGAGFAPLYPALTLLATEGLDERRHGAGIGIFSGAGSLGSTVGALFGGALIAGIGWTPSFLVIGLVAAVAIVPLTLRLRRP